MTESPVTILPFKLYGFYQVTTWKLEVFARRCPSLATMKVLILSVKSHLSHIWSLKSTALTIIRALVIMQKVWGRCSTWIVSFSVPVIYSGIRALLKISLLWYFFFINDTTVCSADFRSAGTQKLIRQKVCCSATEKCISWQIRSLLRYILNQVLLFAYCSPVGKLIAGMQLFWR